MIRIIVKSSKLRSPNEHASPCHPPRRRVMLTHMDETPAKRWFRFRLSTVLIVTAITAWGMATPLSRNNVYPNPHLAWPALTLAVYVGWKAAWATPDDGPIVRPWLFVGGVGAIAYIASWLILSHLVLREVHDHIVSLLIVVLYLALLLVVAAVVGLIVTLWRRRTDSRRALTR